MRIHSSRLIHSMEFSPDASKPEHEKQSKASGVANSRSPSDNVKVTLSDEARRLAAEQAQADYDELKVSRLRDLLQRGKLSVDAKSIADRILDGGARFERS